MIKSERGLEIGEIVGSHCYRGGCFRNDCRQVAEYHKNDEKRIVLENAGVVVRFASDDDLIEREHIIASEKEELTTVQGFADEMELPMKMIDAEHLFGGERIIVYFSSDGRVDFRELVKKMAREYRTRIELRQIGARDETRIISDYESCGQECCCRRFLQVLEPVNMRMAKLQKATLDPSKISGHCGRLKCCLRYEDATYQELKKNLPKKNTRVRSGRFEGKVVNIEILTQLVVVQDEKGHREVFGIEDIELVSDVPSGNGEDKTSKAERKDQTGKEGDAKGEIKTHQDSSEINVDNNRSGGDNGREDRPADANNRKRNRRNNNNSRRDNKENRPGLEQAQDRGGDNNPSSENNV